MEDDIPNLWIKQKDRWMLISDPSTIQDDEESFFDLDYSRQRDVAGETEEDISQVSGEPYNMNQEKEDKRSKIDRERQIDIKPDLSVSKLKFQNVDGTENNKMEDGKEQIERKSCISCRGNTKTSSTNEVCISDLAIAKPFIQAKENGVCINSSSYLSSNCSENNSCVTSSNDDNCSMTPASCRGCTVGAYVCSGNTEEEKGAKNFTCFPDCKEKSQLKSAFQPVSECSQEEYGIESFMLDPPRPPPTWMRFFSKRFSCLRPRKGKDPFEQYRETVEKIHEAQLVRHQRSLVRETNSIDTGSDCEWYSPPESCRELSPRYSELEKRISPENEKSCYATPRPSSVHVILHDLENKRQDFILKQKHWRTRTSSTLESNEKDERLKLPQHQNERNKERDIHFMSKVLFDAAVRCFASLDCRDFPIVFDNDGLIIWKKELGVRRMILRAEFLLPVSPQNYAAFASNTTLRRQWDQNISNSFQVEKINSKIDITYSAFRRIATIFPRDIVTLRVRDHWNVRGNEMNDNSFGFSCERGEKDRVDDLNATEDKNFEAYVSCSCSIKHPDIPEQSGYVRMDVFINAYLAFPFKSPFGVWSRVTLFSEADPKGWIPTVVAQNFAVKTLPSTIEKMSRQLLKTYGVSWNGPNAYGFAYRCLKPIGPFLEENHQDYVKCQNRARNFRETSFQMNE